MDLDQHRAVTWPAGATSHLSDLGGTTIRHLDLGGPPGAPLLVCLHGLGGSALNWGVLGPLLTPTHRVLALDLTGHGQSAAGPGRGAGAADREVVRAFLTTVGGPVTLVGHSMGGVLAAAHAAEHPASVERLVLLSPPVPRPTRWGWDPVLGSKLLLLGAPGVHAAVLRSMRGKTAEELGRLELQRATPHGDRIPADAVAASLAEIAERLGRPDLRRAQQTQWSGILDTLALLARPRRWRETLARITAPTLWIAGTDDPLAPIAHARHLAASRPGWRFAERPGVGHLPHLEDAPGTASVLLDWLAAPVSRG